MTIRLITDEVKVHKYFKSSNEFISNKTGVFTAPNCTSLLVCFGEHIKEGKDAPQPPLILKALENDIGIIYITDVMPKNPIKHHNIIYLESGWKWYIHTLFYNPLIFKGVIYNIKTTTLSLRSSKAFATYTKYKIPEIKEIIDLENITKNIIISKGNILLEIRGGLGDHIMCLPTIKQMYLNRLRVSVLIPEQYKELFEEQYYVNKVYTKKQQVNIAEFDDIKIIDFGQVLNDYRLELNKKNRILSVAEYCGIREHELADKCPNIRIPKKIQDNINRKFIPYKNKLFLGYDSNRTDGKLPIEKAQKLVYRLRTKGYTIFTATNKKSKLNDCIDLSQKLTVMELIALINIMDHVLTVDTSYLHIAGALGKDTTCLMNYLEPSWRCSYYPTVSAFTPDVSCFPCFPEDALITTITGLQPIKDIKLGDKVLTHTGKFLPVTRTFKRNYKGQLSKINILGWKDDIISTPNHPFYDPLKGEWVEAKDLHIGDHLYRPQSNTTPNNHIYSMEQYVEGSNYVLYDNYIKQVSKVALNNTRIHPIKNKVILDSNLAKLFGYYLAEGSLKDSVIKFTFHKDEEDYKKDVFKLMKLCFDLPGGISYSKYDKSCQLEFSSKIVSNFFKLVCGRNTLKIKTKNIPKEVYTSNKGVILELLQGFINGDAGKTYKNEFQIKITEEKLAKGLYTLCTLIGIPAFYSYYVNSPSSYHDYPWLSYHVTISKRAFKEIKYNKKSFWYHKRGDYFINKVDTIPNYNGLVYNLEVAEDNSYCVNGYAVHNCTCMQFVANKNMKCVGNSCFNYFKWDDIICHILKQKNKNKIKNKDILIETEDGLGDVLMSIPSALTWHQRGYNIYYYVKENNKEIFNNLPFIKKVFTNKEDLVFNSFEKHFILTYRLSDYKKPYNIQHRIYSSAYFCGLTKEELIVDVPQLILTKKEVHWGKDKLKSKTKTVLISGNACSKDRTLPENYIQALSTKLTMLGYTPIIVATDDYNYVDCINLTGKTNIRELFSIINAVDYIIAVDTGILHIAGAFYKPTLGLFGPIEGYWRCGTYENCRWLQSPTKCSPCSDKQHIDLNIKACNRQEGKCMFNITPDIILTEFNKLIRK